MKLLHLADLHLGKRVNEFSMLKDQEYILEQVLSLADTQKVDGVLVAGDVFDKTVPSVEAVSLLDDFLTKLSGLHIPVYIISGNHDSPQRLSFGAHLMEGSGIYMAGEYLGEVKKVCTGDAYGPVDIYLLPFVKPAQVRAVWKEEGQEIETYQDAVSFVLQKVQVDKERRNVLVAHQFVAGAQVCDSEERSVGGIDQIDASCLAGFDYVALGHLHGPQQAGGETIRYAGTLLKYSFSEIHHHKGITLVELGEKGDVSIRMFPLKPLHEMRQIRGRYEEITKRANYENTDTADYMRIILTDEEDIFDAVGKLRAIYPNLMRLEYDNTRTGSCQMLQTETAAPEKGPAEFVEELFTMQNQKSMDEQQKAYMERLIRQVWEEDV